METTLGLVGKDYVIVAADRSAARSIVVFKQDEDRVLALDSHKLLGSSGVAADSTAFTEYVQKNVALYEINTGLKLSTAAAASFARGELAHALRRGPYQTNLLLGGFDDAVGPSLYYIDYLASSNKVNYGCHGYASNFVLSIMDREWKDGLTFDQGLDVVKKCVAELRVRFLISLGPDFTVKVVDKDGVRLVDPQALGLTSASRDATTTSTSPAVEAAAA